MVNQIEQTAEPPSEEPDLPLDRWEAVARAVIRECLDPHGLTVPESEFRAWVVALGRRYENRSCR